jgi:hypothetical protein
MAEVVGAHMFFSYLIVPKGDQAGQALTGGHLSIGNLEKRSGTFKRFLLRTWRSTASLK